VLIAVGIGREDVGNVNLSPVRELQPSKSTNAAVWTQTWRAKGCINIHEFRMKNMPIGCSAESTMLLCAREILAKYFSCERKHRVYIELRRARILRFPGNSVDAVAPTSVALTSDWDAISSDLINNE